MLDLEAMEASANAVLNGEEEEKEQPQAEEAPIPEVEEEEAAQEAPDDEPEEAEEEAPEEKPINHAHQRISAKRRAEAAEREAQELRLKIARLEGAQEAMQKPKEEAKPQEPEDPEPEKDTFEHYEWKMRQMEAQQQKLMQRLEETDRQRQAQEALNLWKQKDTEMATANPVYKGAMAHIRNELRREIAERQPGIGKDQIEAQANHFEHQFIAQLSAAQLPIDAMVIAEAYKAGFSYTPEASQQVPPQPAKQAFTDKREVSHAKRTGGTLAASGASGGLGRRSTDDIATMSIEAIMNMPESEYRSAFAK